MAVLAQASTGLKVVSPAQLATNLLINPGFEDGVLLGTLGVGLGQVQRGGN